MIVECPRCNARYRVAEDVIADEPTFKCSRCSHFFGQDAIGVVAAAKEAAPKGDAEESESLDEADPEPADSAAAEAEPAPVAAPPPPESLRARRVSRIRPEPESLSLPFSAPRTAAETDEAPGSDLVDGADEPDFDLPQDDDGEEEFAIGSTPVTESRPRFLDETPASEANGARDRVRRPYLIFLGVLLLVFGNLALYLRNHADAADRVLASVPFAGRILVENRLLQSRVYLRDIEGVYQQIKDGRTVFIVTGRAVNTAEAPLKGVEIESALYDAGGTPLVTKSIYCGNAMSLKIVKDLSSKEISILQRLQPPQRFEIAPGEAAGFSVVFLDPPAGFKEFSARVTAAQPALS